jgi:DNA mismatch endonuclease (patch repair protein)
MRDLLTKAERSAHMAKVRGKGNRSTELVVEETLMGSRIRGWVKHPQNIIGRPDFYFRRAKLALFVDGCFWHACPKCDRRTPTTRSDFWRRKIAQNRRRDGRVRRELRKQGVHAIRIWEHELRDGKWLTRIRGALKKLSPHQRELQS